MPRTRAWRRHKNYTKAKRKRRIDLDVSWYFDPLFRGRYRNLHQYSKNKIHCSCPMCAVKTRNKGQRKKRWAPALNYGMQDKRRQMAMDYDQENFEKGETYEGTQV